MPKAVWKGTVIAESDDTVVVEGNHYFPPDSVRWDHLEESSKTTTCPWKGRASYYDVVVDGDANRDAAWYYPNPSSAARPIAGHLAFWRGVRIEASDSGSRAEPATVLRSSGRSSGWGGGLLRLLGSRSGAGAR